MTATPSDDSAEVRAADAAGALDLLLSAAALGAMRTIRPDVTMLRRALQLARRPQTVADIADHLCPWQSCYQSTQMLGGSVRFVLSTSGHIAAMVNPRRTRRRPSRWPRPRRTTRPSRVSGWARP
jgi:hypothetical protein